MSQEDLKAALTRHALALCMQRLGSGSASVPTRMLQSVQVQLEWLIEFYEGRSTDRATLRELTFGHIAAREMEGTDPELVNALHRAYYAASRTAAGLKLDMAVLGVEA